MADSNKILVIIASDYPYGPGEPFLENELFFLSKSFNKIFFITTSELDKSKTIIFHTPENSEIINLNIKTKSLSEKFFFLKKRFLKIIIKEIFIAKKHYKLPISLSLLRVCFFYINRAYLFKTEVINKLSRHIKSENLYFYSYWCTEFTLGMVLLKKKYPKIKLFSRIHGWDVYFERNNPKYLPFRSAIFNNLNALFTISDNGKEYLTNKVPVNENKIITLKLGTFLPKAKSIYTRQKSLRILSIAYIVELKRLPLLISGISLLDIDIEWTHIGGGKLFNETLNFAKEKLNEKQNIKFNLLGNKSKQEIYELMSSNNFDVFINTSSTEGIPVSMMEAMSFGIPCIGTNVGGVSEIILQDFNGILLSPNPTSTEIAEALKIFSEYSTDEVLKYRNNAFSTWEQKHNAETNYKNLVLEIEKIN